MITDTTMTMTVHQDIYTWPIHPRGLLRCQASLFIASSMLLYTAWTIVTISTAAKYSLFRPPRAVSTFLHNKLHVDFFNV